MHIERLLSLIRRAVCAAGMLGQWAAMHLGAGGADLETVSGAGLRRENVPIAAVEALHETAQPK
eukprot:8983423-Prorocentrum_lima.AAC.1